MREVKQGLPSWFDYIIDVYVAGSITYLIIGPIAEKNPSIAVAFAFIVGPLFAIFRNLFRRFTE